MSKKNLLIMLACLVSFSTFSTSAKARGFEDEFVDILSSTGSLFDDVYQGANKRLKKAIKVLKEDRPSGATVARLDGDKYRIEFALPGYSKKQINASIEKENNLAYLKVTADKKESSKHEDKGNISSFFGQSSAESKISLPDFVDAQSAKVSYKDGILIVTFKVSETKKESSIELEIK